MHASQSDGKESEANILALSLIVGWFLFSDLVKTLVGVGGVSIYIIVDYTPLPTAISNLLRHGMHVMTS